MKSIVRLDLGGPQIFFEAGDITQQATDAIVNAANSSLMGGGGVDGAIHRAGGPAILEECRKIVARDGHLPPGEAVQTTGGDLNASFVIHTVGPIWRDGMQGESGILASAYRNSMRLADRLGLHSIALPAISTGVYGYRSSPLRAACTRRASCSSTRRCSPFFFRPPENFISGAMPPTGTSPPSKSTRKGFKNFIPLRGKYEPQEDHCSQLEDV